jgi:chromosomal replication initiator protein
VAYASLNGVPVDQQLVEDVLRDQYPRGPDRDRRADPEGRGGRVRRDRGRPEVGPRTQAIVYPRQLAMYLCRELTDLSLPKVGVKFGGRDHTTVHYAEAKITRLIREDRSVYNLVQDLTTRIRRI